MNNERFPNASASFRAANPELFEPEKRARSEEGNAPPVRPELERRVADAAVGEKKAKGGDRQRFLVRVTSVRRRLIDEDNLCAKYVVDCCRNAGLIPDDCPATTRIETTQRKAGKEEQEHTLIEIFDL